MLLLLCLIYLFDSKLVNSQIIPEDCLNYTIYPVQYELTLTPYFMKNYFHFQCETVITIISSLKGVNILELDVKDLEIKKGSVGVYYENENIVDSAEPFILDTFNGRMYINLRQGLEKYETDGKKYQYQLKMSSSGFMNRDQHGLFYIPYTDMNIDKYLLSTYLSPNRASTVFPCFNNPRYESTYKIKMYLPSSTLTGITIAPEMRRQTLHSGYTLVEFLPSPQIAPHQVGFHISDFRSNIPMTQVKDDAFYVWTKVENVILSTYIQSAGVELIQNLKKYLRSDILTVGPIHLIALPGYNKGFEKGSWNLLTTSEDKVLVVEKTTSAKQKAKMTEELAKQLARIFLGNPGQAPVTRWKEYWFKEGLSTYLAYFVMTKSDKTSMASFTEYSLKFMQTAMENDCFENSRPLIYYEKSVEMVISKAEETFLSTKTAAILRMIEDWLGSDVFHGFLTKFLHSRKGQTVSFDDFKSYLEEKITQCPFLQGHSMVEIINTWTQQPGYPIVNVNVSKDNMVYISQKRYTLDIDGPLRNHNYLIPISYETQFDENCGHCKFPRFLLKGGKYSFKERLKGGWILLDVNGAGYYRVNYDVDSWRKIISTLNGPQKSQINYLNRAKLINDAFALYIAGYLDIETTKGVLDSLSNELEETVWEAAFAGFGLLKNNGVYLSKQMYEHWKAFMREKVSGLYLKRSTNYERDLKTRLFKSKLIKFACGIGHHLCLKDINNEIDRVRKGQTYDPDLRESSYREIIKSRSLSSTVNIKFFDSFESEDFIAMNNEAKEEEMFINSLSLMTPIPVQYSPPVKLMPTPTKPQQIVHELGMTRKMSSAKPSSANTTYRRSCLLILLLAIAVKF